MFFISNQGRYLGDSQLIWLSEPSGNQRKAECDFGEFARGAKRRRGQSLVLQGGLLIPHKVLTRLLRPPNLPLLFFLFNKPHKAPCSLKIQLGI
jgi:hypothetical protein